MTSILTIESESVSASISTLGAELQTLRDAAGRDLLWDGDPKVWAGRAPILFPIVGELHGGRYRVGGTTYVLPRHGFARRSLFTVVEHTGDQAVLRLEADAQTRAVYPFDFSLDLTFAVAGARLSMTAAVSNTGADPLPVGFGFHPAFRWPLPSGATRSAHEIIFTEAELGPIRRLDKAGLIDPTEMATPVEGCVLKLEDSLFVNDAIIMTHPVSRSLTYGAPGGPGLAIDFVDFPQLGIWSKPGAGYVCIEPWQSHADFAGFDGEIWEKPGIVAIEPGSTRRWQMGVALA